jgi:GNAT superfamily N-acetyltransferase
MITEPEVVLEPFVPTAVTYTAITHIENEIYPDWARTPAEVELEDRAMPPHVHWERWLLRHTPTNQYIGYGAWGHTHWAYDPGLYFVGVYVLPEWQGMGHGRVLYNHLLPLVLARQPHTLRSEARSDHGRAIRFLEERGYILGLREHISRLYLRDFDPTPYTPATLPIHTLTELAANDPDYWRKRYELEVIVEQDIPWLNDFTPLPFEEWLAAEQIQQKTIPHLSYIAVDGDQYVGISSLRRSHVHEEVLYVGLTGVRREYRRRGLAMSLKVAGLVRAQAHFAQHPKGAQAVIVTENEENNPMYTINETLGFRNYADWLFYTQAILPPAS